MILALSLLFACSSTPSYIVEGKVVEVRPNEVVLDHEAIAGLMPAMIMPFQVDDPAMLTGVAPGNEVFGRLEVRPEGAVLVNLRVTAQGTPPVKAAPVPEDAFVHVGEVFPSFQVPVTDGTVWTVGAGQAPTLVTFVYTRCPVPEACPMVVSRLAAVQEKLAGSPARILAVTIDPAFDTLPVLKQYGEEHGADPARWQFGRLDDLPLRGLAERASLRTLQTDDAAQIEHGIRFLVIGADGRLIERYDDGRWPLDRLVSQLTTGGPPAADNATGTIYPE